MWVLLPEGSAMSAEYLWAQRRILWAALERLGSFGRNTAKVITADFDKIFLRD